MPDKDPVLKSTEAADREAFDQIKAQRDQATAERDKATGALDTMMKVQDAARALNGKVADPFTVAELIAPRLGEVKREDVAVHVTSDAFAPHLAAFRGLESPPTPPDGGDPPAPGAEPPAEPPAVEPAGGGFGPSPGTSAGTQPRPGKEAIVVGTPAYRELLAGPPEAVKQAYDENRVVQPTRPFQT